MPIRFACSRSLINASYKECLIGIDSVPTSITFCLNSIIMPFSYVIYYILNNSLHRDSELAEWRFRVLIFNLCPSIMFYYPSKDSNASIKQFSSWSTCRARNVLGCALFFRTISGFPRQRIGIYYFVSKQILNVPNLTLIGYLDRPPCTGCVPIESRSSMSGSLNKSAIARLGGFFGYSSRN